jgi:hypothetical protein
VHTKQTRERDSRRAAARSGKNKYQQCPEYSECSGNNKCNGFAACRETITQLLLPATDVTITLCGRNNIAPPSPHQPKASMMMAALPSLTDIVLNIQNVPGAIIATPFHGKPRNTVQLL